MSIVKFRFLFLLFKLNFIKIFRCPILKDPCDISYGLKIFHSTAIIPVSSLSQIGSSFKRVCGFHNTLFISVTKARCRTWLKVVDIGGSLQPLDSLGHEMVYCSFGTGSCNHRTNFVVHRKANTGMGLPASKLNYIIDVPV